MKNKCTVVMLPTNEATVGTIMLYAERMTNHDDEIDIQVGQLTLNKNSYVRGHNTWWKPQHLYILSDDEIGEGDWVIANQNKRLIQCKSFKIYSDKKYVVDSDGKEINIFWCKKIIATTDPKFLRVQPNGTINKIFDPLAPIPEPFIQAYIKAYNEGTPITEVMVEMEHDGPFLGFIETGEDISDFKPKLRPDGTIIISKVREKFSGDEMHMNMQYYMEYCKDNKYVTPQYWLDNLKSF